jgi:hypothetical protein
VTSDLTRLTTRVVLLAGLAAPAAAQQLAPEERARIDSAAVAVLAGTGAPSASVAIVRGGEIVYEQAYGEGRIGTPATTGHAVRHRVGEQAVHRHGDSSAWRKRANYHSMTRSRAGSPSSRAPTR